MAKNEITKCLSCGGDLVPNSKGIPTCECCGREYKNGVGGFSDELREIVNRRQLREFRQAEELCEELQRKQPENPEVYWQTLLTSLGVVYVQEGNKSKPTFFSYSYSDRDLIKDNPNYKNALKYADTEDREHYQKQAKVLDELLKEFFNLVAKEDSYDVFISFKRTTDATVNGEVRQIETDDCKKAEEIYKYFNKKYKVFFSPVSIGKDTGIVGEKYEPRILKALQTSQVMILLGSRLEYLEAQWVQNEWKRYQYFINKGKKNKASLILGYEKYMPPLPAALKEIQLDNFDWYSGGYLKELEKKLEPLVRSSKGFMSKLTQKKSASEYFQSDEGEFNSGYNADRITFNSKGKNVEIKIPANEQRDMQTAENSRFRGKFKDAVTRYSEILKLNPENAQAYWFRFCSKLGVKDDQDVPKAMPDARKEYYADVDSAVQKTNDEKFYWHIIDTLICSYSITSTSWKQLEMLSDCLIKYIDESRSKNVLSYLEDQYRYYIKNGNIKTAEEVFASSRKLFFDANLDYNIGYMKNYAICLYQKGEYDLARKYFEELAGARKDAEVYLYLLKCRVKTQDIESTSFKLKIDPSDDPAAKKPSELDLDEIIERIILCKPTAEIFTTLNNIVMYQIAHNRKNAGDFVVTIASCIKNSDAEYENNDNLITFLSAVANRFIQVKDFKNAKIYYTEILNVNPNYSKAHWGLLKCRLKAFDDYDVIKHKKSLQSYEEYNNALNCSTNEEYEEYIAIYNAQDEHNTKGRERTNRKVWLALTKSKRAVKKLVTALCIIGVCIFGVYSYFGITNPVYYAGDGSAKVTGRSMYFGMLVSDLVLEERDGTGITEVGDGAFKNSSINTLVLGNKLTVIGEKAFAGNKKLTSVNAKSANISIGDYAFKNCEKLEEFTIGGASSKAVSSVKGVSIGEGAFEGCNSLKTLTISNCSFIGKNAFSGCEQLKEIKINISNAKNIADGAFDGTSANLKVYVPTVEEKVLADLKSKHKKVNFVTYTRDSVEECIYFINKIGTVTLNSKADIDKAFILYNALSQSEKNSVSNSSDLTSAHAVYNTMVYINDIGTVTVDKENKVVLAENAYGALTDSQKVQILNYSTLVSARDQIQSMLVDKMIEAIGTVTLDKETQIIGVEEAYAQLTSSQQSRVNNYSTLTAARTQLDNLRVENTISKINNIGTVELTSRQLIVDAENTYASLTSELQDRVTNYTVLTDARAVFDVMTLIEDIGIVNINSQSAINNAIIAHNALTAQQKAQVTNYGQIAEKRSIYTLAKAIENFGTVYLGKDANYTYKTVTAESMPALNDNAVCEEISSITISGLKKINKTDWKKVLPNLDTVRYDASGATTYTSTFELDSSLAYYIKGREVEGMVFETTLTATAGETINITFDNFRFRSLNISDVNEAYVKFNGNCYIGGSGIAIQARKVTLTMEPGADVMLYAGAGSMGISATRLTITDIPSTANPAYMSVYGGASSSYSGGIGIVVYDMTVNMSGTLSVRGGDGGRGTNASSTSYGAAGGKGGDGGVGVSTGKLTVLKGRVEIYGGNGGMGGTGSMGATGSNATGITNKGGKGKTGGEGGTGGSGAQAVEFISIAEEPLLVISSGTCILTAGEGGRGGNGGTGGTGGKGSGGGAFSYNGGAGGDGGTGGAGGIGGSAGCNKATVQSENNVIVGAEAELRVYEGKAGKGGDGGAGGTGGNGGSHWGALGSNGKKGNTGASGNSGANGAAPVTDSTNILFTLYGVSQ